MSPTSSLPSVHHVELKMALWGSCHCPTFTRKSGIQRTPSLPSPQSEGLGSSPNPGCPHPLPRPWPGGGQPGSAWTLPLWARKPVAAPGTLSRCPRLCRN